MQLSASKIPQSAGILYFGGKSGDLQDTIESVKGIREALEVRGRKVIAQEVNKENWRKAVKLPGDVVFNLVEDPGWDLYCKVGSALEEMGRAQVGHDSKVLKYATQKTSIKKKLIQSRISTPNFRIFTRSDKSFQVKQMEYPLIVKLSGEHAGIGITQDSVVIDPEELEDRVEYLFKNYKGDVIVEEFIEGREIHATVMGNGDDAEVMPLCEILFEGEFAQNWDVYTYQAKWEKESWEYWAARVKADPQMSRDLKKKIKKLALKTYKKLECRDIARVDIRVNNKEIPFVVDVNVSPSLNRYDDQDATLKSMEAMGLTYEMFIEKISAIAYKRIHI